MRPFLLIVLLLILTAGKSQTASLPTWFADTFKSKGLDKKYIIASFLNPSYLHADFNGDISEVKQSFIRTIFKYNRYYLAFFEKQTKDVQKPHTAVNHHYGKSAR